MLGQLLYWLISASLGVAGNLPDRLNQTFEKSKIKSGEWSLAIGGSTPWSKSGSQLLIPASVTKLFTAAWVLESLEPATKLTTTLRGRTDHNPKSPGRLNGDLCFVGAGDPSFVSENLWVLVNNFTRTGIREVSGDVLVDESLFDAIRFDDSRDSVRVDRAFDAPISALSFNWNSVNTYIRPSKVGSPAIVYLDPENSYATLENHATTKKGGGSSTIAVSREGDFRFVVTGQIGLGDPEKAIFKNITDPALWAGSNLISFLGQRNISVKGKVRRGICSADHEILASSESKPIEHMVTDMNKFSNNFVAEMLTKLVASRTQTPASLATGIKELNSFLQKDCKNCYIESPSGFSRKNRLSAQSVVNLLVKIRDTSAFYPELASSLPIAGRDGTLRRRLKGKKGEGLIRAKTGHLSGVVGLAGYAGDTPFAFFYNGTGDESHVRALFDQLAEEIVQ